MKAPTIRNVCVFCGSNTGSRPAYAAAAAKALLRRCPDLTAEEIVRDSLLVASEICIYTSDAIQVETLDAEQSA